jgi:hypothetical protein
MRDARTIQHRLESNLGEVLPLQMPKSRKKKARQRAAEKAARAKANQIPPRSEADQLRAEASAFEADSNDRRRFS